MPKFNGVEMSTEEFNAKLKEEHDKYWPAREVSLNLIAGAMEVGRDLYLLGNFGGFGGAMTGYSSGSGGFNNALSKLNGIGFIHRNNGMLQINADADYAPYLDGTSHTLQDWISKLGQCERKIYELVLSRPDETLSKEEVAEQTGYQVGSGGFNNSLSRLNTLGLIQRNQGQIKLNPDIASL